MKTDKKIKECRWCDAELPIGEDAERVLDEIAINDGYCSEKCKAAAESFKGFFEPPSLSR